MDQNQRAHAVAHAVQSFNNGLLRQDRESSQKAAEVVANLLRGGSYGHVTGLATECADTWDALAKDPSLAGRHPVLFGTLTATSLSLHRMPSLLRRAYDRAVARLTGR